MALTTTLHSATADSYVTLAEADTFFANHYLLAKQTAWDVFSSGQKEMLLRRACQVIETLPLEDQIFFRQVVDQALTFPRNADLVDGIYVMPQIVKDAQCEQAIYLSVFDDSELSDQMKGVSNVSVSGGVSMSTTYVGLGSVVAPMAFALLGPLLRRSSQLRRA